MALDRNVFVKIAFLTARMESVGWAAPIDVLQMVGAAHPTKARAILL
jgi:hypothetical protein